MRLEEITVRLRRRTAWEALDLGHALLRAWAGPSYRAWFVTYWSAGIALMAVFGFLWEWTFGAILALWCLKPLFDRVLLRTYSLALFGQNATLADAVRALPGVLRQPGMLSGLTLRRLSLARSFLLPVWQLEQQSGVAARARFRVLGRRASGSAAWLTVVCAHLVLILWFSIILLAEWLMPVGSEGLIFYSGLFPISGEAPWWREVLIVLGYMAAETLVEPLYVASGFSLYLNRRSELEAWDIDLAFRRLAARLSEAAGAGMGAGFVVLLLCAGLLAVPEPVHAEKASLAAPATVAPSRPKQVIREILADPVFGREIEEKRWKLRQDKEEKEEREPSGLDPYFDKLARMFESLVGGLRVVAWIVAGIVAAFLVYLIIRYREYWLPGGREKPLPPEFLFGLDVRPQSLPDDVVAAARAALAAGRVEEALSLLYRGALVVLIHRVQVEFRAGDTEGDCLYRVHGRLQFAAERYFRLLLEHWRHVAYARRVPPLPDLEALCSGWEEHFGRQENTA
ncbi:MAG: hypothetical protein BWY57_03230 [Betaproteobacteria bacterium ADurb.Bin341]|nr:MAG: hypothetical protein BWY57_03230 [Betaproteobacteria bacterium ADurb.Bin341]